jgi:hypothetical protein
MPSLLLLLLLHPTHTLPYLTALVTESPSDRK